MKQSSLNVKNEEQVTDAYIMQRINEVKQSSAILNKPLKLYPADDTSYYVKLSYATHLGRPLRKKNKKQK